MPKYEIYLITNKVNGKKYVGQVSSKKGIYCRFNEHIYESLHIYKNEIREKHSKTCLHKAINKYGVDNFTIELVENNIDESLIDERERYWISYYKSFVKDGGYNMTTGGQGIHNYKFTEDDLKNISSKVKSYWIDLKENHRDEYERVCKHMSEINKGLKRTQDTKDKLSELGKKRVGNLNSFYGKSHNDNTKQLIREANSKRVGMFDLDDNLIKEFDSIYRAVQYLLDNGITTNKNASSRISKICRGIDKTAYGYIWKFL